MAQGLKGDLGHQRGGQRLLRATEGYWCPQNPDKHKAGNFCKTQYSTQLVEAAEIVEHGAHRIYVTTKEVTSETFCMQSNLNSKCL